MEVQPQAVATERMVPDIGAVVEKSGIFRCSDGDRKADGYMERGEGVEETVAAERGWITYSCCHSQT